MRILLYLIEVLYEKNYLLNYFKNILVLFSVVIHKMNMLYFEIELKSFFKIIKFD